MVAANRAAGRLKFTTDIAAAVEHGEVIFIAVGTPPDENGCVSACKFDPVRLGIGVQV